MPSALSQRQVEDVGFRVPQHREAFRSDREIDVVIIGERRIFVVDIKDLYGRIESGDGGWTVGGSDFESSPVAEVNDIARNIYILLKPAMANI